MKSYQKQSMEITIKPSWNPVKIHSKSPYLRSARTSAVVPSAGAATSTTQWRPSWPGPGCDGRPRGSCPVTKNQSLLYVIMVGLYVVMVITTIINVILCYYMLQLCYNYVAIMLPYIIVGGYISYSHFSKEIVKVFLCCFLDIWILVPHVGNNV